MAKFKDLVGKILTEIKKNEDNDELIFVVEDGTKYIMYHAQEYCENVWIEDINGDLDDLIGTPIIKAEEVLNYEPTSEEDIEKTKEANNLPGYYEWAFYKLATIKGYVDIRWFGESTGYYSVNVDFDLLF
jgi:hypothetical protein